MSNYFVFYIGKFKRLLFTVTDADTHLPVNITNASFYFTVKVSRTDKDQQAIVQKTVGSGITILDGAYGKGQIDILSADTSTLVLTDRSSLFWDLEMLLTVGVPEIVGSGTCSLLVAVTGANA